MPFSLSLFSTATSPPALAVPLLEACPDPIVAAADDGTLLFCNRAAERLFGWNGPEVLNCSLHELVCCEHLQARHTSTHCPLFAAVGRNDGSAQEATWVRTDGIGINVSYRRVSLQLGDDLQAWAFLIKALDPEQLSAAEYQRIVSFPENNPAPIVELDASASLLYTNPAMMDLLLLHGYGETGIPVVLPADLPALVADCFANASSLSDIESHCDDRTYLWHFHYEHDRKVIQAYGTDVTTLKRAQRALEAAKLAAEQATLAKSAFLANMSHEIRTPMNGVLGMLELLSSTPLTEPQQNYVHTARSSADALVSVINDILDFSKIEAGKLRIESIDVNLPGLLDDVIRLLQESARDKALELLCDRPADLPKGIRTDPTRLRQILVNLLGNAIKFTAQGSVTLQVRLVSQDERQPMLRFAVCDTGIGIPAEAQSLLFRSFQQADESTTRRFGGTGLGLAICKQLTELMGGAIGVESLPEHGSTFWFTLPLVQSMVATSAPVPAAETRPKYEASVLLVEDNRVNQLVAVGMLGKYGIKPDIANNGLEAVSAVETGRYDLIFMDCQMPELDGYTATQRIRTLNRGCTEHLPIVAMTANAMEADRERCSHAGMDDYLSKPVSINNLGQTLEKWLGPKLKLAS